MPPLPTTARPYAETKGKTPFDWTAFLTRAAKEPINDQEWEDAAILSRDWVTCSVGTQCRVLPRDTTGAPEDKVLGRLGGGDGGFHTAILRKDADLALHLLRLVELHSAYLLRKEAARRKNALEKAKELVEEVKDWIAAA